MTAEQFRRMALRLPEAQESAHMAHPDFRVRGKIFATLGYPDKGWGMVKLSAEDQRIYAGSRPDTFQPAPGAWGRQGATLVQLKSADQEMVREALNAAWRRTAPKTLVARSRAGGL